MKPWMWTALGITWALGALTGACYLNSLVNIGDWVYAGKWWHLPIAVALVLLVVSVFAQLMTEGTMLSIYGSDYLKKLRHRSDARAEHG